MSQGGAGDDQKIAELGEIGDEVLVFGGPYSNLDATEALLAEARAQGIGSERIICTGDVAAYGAEPEATVRLLRQSGVHVVMGNCEESLSQGSDDCGCGYAQDSVCDVLSRRWFAYAAAELSHGSKRWMGGLPRRLGFRLGGRRLCVVHGGVSRINRLIFTSTPKRAKAREIASSGADGVIAGHSGLPFTDIVGAKLWHNAGVIGQPANDGTSRAWYSILRATVEGVAVRHHTFTYDHRAAAAKMRRNGLPEEYADSLITGLWHNCDILPPDETTRRGTPIELPGLTWAA